jgi:hypothetical protein
LIILKSSNSQILKSTTRPIITAVTSRFRASQQSIDDSCCAADPGFDANGSLGAIQGTGTAFHAKIPVFYECFLIGEPKDCMRAYRGAHAAAVAKGYVKIQGDNVS